MAGIKIINVLKDDTLPEILEVFRQAPAGEVIFVLPKNGKVFHSEDHFAAFAAEATATGKTISIMTANAVTASHARAHGFNVMTAKPKRARTPKAVVVSNPPPADDDIVDTSEDAFQDDVPLTSDERQQVVGQDEREEETNPPPGFHIEDDDQGAPVEVADDDTGAELASARRKMPVPQTANEDLDYIDKVWRDRAAQQASVRTMPPAPSLWSRMRVRPHLPSVTFRRFTRSVVVVAAVAAVVVLGATVYLTTGSASVVITPVSQPLDERITVTASDAIASVDPTFGKIPGQLIELTKSATATATASGQRTVASKARGRIIISNSYSSTPQTLVSTTRFTSAGGLVYRTLSTVTVPGTTVNAGVAVPGTVTVDVIADQPGSQYDIPAGTFKIAAYVEKGDTERAAKVFGTSTDPMTGGANGPSAVVQQADYDKAHDDALAAVTKAVQDALATQADGMRIASAVDSGNTAFTSSARVDDAAASVSVTATTTLTTVAFRQADLDRIVADTILQKDRLVVDPAQVQENISGVTFDPTLHTLSFTVAVTGPGYKPVDAAAVANDITGMDSSAFQAYISGRADIQQAALSLHPFWTRSIPHKTDAIHVELQDR